MPSDGKRRESAPPRLRVVTPLNAERCSKVCRWTKPRNKFDWSTTKSGRFIVVTDENIKSAAGKVDLKIIQVAALRKRRKKLRQCESQRVTVCFWNDIFKSCVQVDKCVLINKMSQCRSATSERPAFKAAVKIHWYYISGLLDHCNMSTFTEAFRISATLLVNSSTCVGRIILVQ